MKNEALFRTGSVWKSIFSMAVPSIIIILVMVLYNMADMFFVGCLGDTAQVAAVSVVGPVFSILAAVATMLGAGSSAIIARCFGAGEIEQGKICSSLCFWTSFFLGVLVSIGLLVGRVPLLGMLGSNAEIFPYAERYLQVLALGAPCFILSNSMAMLVRAEGAVKEGMIGNLLGTLVNCIFDPLFILVLNFGVSGAAAASVLGNLVATACYLRYIVKHGTVLTVDFRPALKKPQMLGELLAIGLPNGISSLLAGFAGTALLVTHNRDEAYRLCKEMIVLNEGQVLRAGKTKEVFADPQSVAAARLTGCKNILPCTPLDSRTVRLDGWDTTLRLALPVPAGCTAVGIRAHDFTPCAADAPNAIPVKAVSTSENPFDWNLICTSPEGTAQLWWKVGKTSLSAAAPEPPQYLCAAPESIMPLKG